MPQKIIVLTGEREAPYLANFLTQLAPDLTVAVLHSKEAFLNETGKGLKGVRLISFLSSIIVPGFVLKQLELTPYNIHPGPPERPGRYPDAFAYVEGASEYGVTVHEMAAKVDEGSIVAVERFALPTNATRLDIAECAEAGAVRMFVWLVNHCLISDAALPNVQETWSGQKTTLRDYENLLQRYPEMQN